MKNKPKANLLNLDSLNTLENSNTMYYILGMVIRWDARKATTNEAKKYEERI